MKTIVTLFMTFLSSILIFAQNELSTFDFESTSFVEGQIKTIEALDYTNDINQYYFDESSVDSLAELLLKHKGLRVEIRCHSDFKDAPLMNLMATADQAREIQYYLVRKGVEGTRVKPIGEGDMFPIYEEDEIAQMSLEQAKLANKLNRRIEVVVTQFDVIDEVSPSSSQGVRSYVSSY